MHDETEFRLDYRAPPDDLARYVTSFYRFSVPWRDDAVARAPWPMLLAPALIGCVPADGEVVRCRLHLLGPAAASPPLDDGEVPSFGVGLTLTGWLALAGAETPAITTRVVATGPDAASAAAWYDLPAALLRRLIVVPDTVSARFATLVDAWLRSAPNPSVTMLARSSGLSRRQVERRCVALCGHPPGLVARRHRAWRVAAALAAGAATLDQLVAGGYCDQSHLIRELKRFIGATPGQLRPRLGHVDPG